MQFQVPQFIEMEDKIVGPLTLKQFGFFAAAFAICFFLFRILTTFFAIMLAIPVVTIAFAFAFGKIKGIPVTKYLINFVGFALKPQMYFWKK